MSEPRLAAGDKWRQIIDDQQSSGLSAAAYCRTHSVGQASFFAWKRKLRAASPASFVEIASASLASSSGGALDLCLPNKRRIRVRRGFDRELLIDLLRALEGAPSTLEGVA